MEQVSLLLHSHRAPMTITGPMARAYAQASGGDFALAGPAPHQAPPMAVAMGTMVLGVKPVLAALLDAHDRRCSVVHFKESMVWHAPLLIDTLYEVHAQLIQHDDRPSGAFARVQVTVATPRGFQVAQTCSTLFLQPMSRKSAAPAALAQPSNAVANATALPSWHVAWDQPDRYAQASSETNPIHLDDAAAQAMGLPGRILHGMCTLAYGARVLTACAQRGGFVQLVGLMARFARPVRPLDTLTCRLLKTSDEATYQFDIVQQDQVVVVSRGTAVFQKL